MYDDPEEEDEERNLALALAMSNPDGVPAAEQQEAPKEEVKPEEQVDIDANFMKDVIGDIGIDIDPN
jgi:hypothetical protein